MSMTSTIFAVLLALGFFSLGTAKILALPLMRERAAEVGFTVGAYRRIGALEVAGAIALLTGLVQPLIGGLAGVGLLLLLGGALVAHLRNGDGRRSSLPPWSVAFWSPTYLIVHFGADALSATPVVIIRVGPAGLTAATPLAHHGVGCLVLDR